MILLIYVFNYFIYLACGEAGEGKGSVGEGLDTKELPLLMWLY